MARNAAQNAEMRNQSRRRLVEAATAVFVRVGFAAARMADIAREAGLSHGLAYHYFPSKDAVFVAVVDQTMGTANEMAEMVLVESEAPLIRLHRLCELMLEGARQNPARSMIMAQVASNPDAPVEARQMLRHWSCGLRTAVAEMIRQAQKSGDLAGDDPLVLARTLLAALSGLAVDTAAEADQVDWPSADILMRLLRSG